MDLSTPTPLKSEHEALYAEIKAATRLHGRTGDAAQLLARLVEQHFAREEAFVLPPLGLLPDLAQGTLEQPMAAAIPLAIRVRDELPDLLAEQRVIVAAVEALMAVAEEQDQGQLAALAERLMLHEEIERRVSYPTSILIGSYLQLKFNP